mgnify:CR=1 FL=1
MSDQDMRAALARLERTTEVGLARIEGRIEVFIERLEQQAQRTAEHADRLDLLDRRVDALERDAVTRGDLDQRHTAGMRTLGIAVSIIGMIVATATSLLVDLAV